VTAYRWTGELRRESDGVIVGTLRDNFGFTIELRGVRTGASYAVTGTPGPTPEEFWIEEIDGDT
jgi:hypothetical protein